MQQSKLPFQPQPPPACVDLTHSDDDEAHPAAGSSRAPTGGAPSSGSSAPNAFSTMLGARRPPLSLARQPPLPQGALLHAGPAVSLASARGAMVAGGHFSDSNSRRSVSVLIGKLHAAASCAAAAAGSSGGSSAAGSSSGLASATARDAIVTLDLGSHSQGDTLGGFMTLARGWLPEGLAERACSEFSDFERWDVHKFAMRDGRVVEGLRKSVWIHDGIEEQGSAAGAGALAPPVHAWDVFPCLQELRQATERLCGVQFTAALVHRYDPAAHKLGLHSDDSDHEVQDAHGLVVASLSFGARRRFIWQWVDDSGVGGGLMAPMQSSSDKADRVAVTYVLPMEPGDALIMSGSCNWWRGAQGWKHGVPAASPEESAGALPRFNVTFRRRLAGSRGGY